MEKKWCKRHTFVGTAGNMLSIVVHVANIHDTNLAFVSAEVLQKVSINSSLLRRCRLSQHDEVK